MPVVTLSCIGAKAFLRRVDSSGGKSLLRMECVVGSPVFDGDVKRKDPQAVRWVPGTNSYEICGVPYTVSDHVASGLAEVRVLRVDR